MRPQMKNTKLIDVKLKLKVNVNKSDMGGYPLISPPNRDNGYVGVVVFDDMGNAISTNAGLYVPKGLEFKPGLSYTSMLYLAISANQSHVLKIGNVIELKVGWAHNDKSWAKCEILDVLLTNK